MVRVLLNFRKNIQKVADGYRNKLATSHVGSPSRFTEDSHKMTTIHEEYSLFSKTQVSKDITNDDE
jgi:hypothetical protein